MSTWILFLVLGTSPPAMHSVAGFVYRTDCEKAGAELQAYAKQERMPALHFTCIEQPRGR